MRLKQRFHHTHINPTISYHLSRFPCAVAIQSLEEHPAKDRVVVRDLFEDHDDHNADDSAIAIVNEEMEDSATPASTDVRDACAKIQTSEVTIAEITINTETSDGTDTTEETPMSATSVYSLDTVSNTEKNGSQTSLLPVWNVRSRSFPWPEIPAAAEAAGDPVSFSLIQEIGEGGNAKVYICDYPKKSVCDYCAIKCSKNAEATTPDCMLPGTLAYEIVWYNTMKPLQGKLIPEIFDWGKFPSGSTSPWARRRAVQHFAPNEAGECAEVQSREDDGIHTRTYIAMELLGPSWEAMIEVGHSAFNFIPQAIDFLEKLHTAFNIVHCDFKPKNVLSRQRMCHDTACFIDFGSCFHMLQGRDVDFPEAHVGTAEYCSDGKLLAERKPMPIDDVISLGYSALHAWLGDLPWDCDIHSSQTFYESKANLKAFTQKRTYTVKQHVKEWHPFFGAWFDYCDGIAKQAVSSGGSVSYDALRKILKDHPLGERKDEAPGPRHKAPPGPSPASDSVSQGEEEPAPKRARMASPSV